MVSSSSIKKLKNRNYFLYSYHVFPVWWVLYSSCWSCDNRQVDALGIIQLTTNLSHLTTLKTRQYRIRRFHERKANIHKSPVKHVTVLKMHVPYIVLWKQCTSSPHQHMVITVSLFKKKFGEGRNFINQSDQWAHGNNSLPWRCNTYLWPVS